MGPMAENSLLHLSVLIRSTLYTFTMHYFYQLLLSSFSLFPPALCHIFPCCLQLYIVISLEHRHSFLIKEVRNRQRLRIECYVIVFSMSIYQTVVMELQCIFAKCQGINSGCKFLCRSYSLNTSTCRAKILVKYFGEDFGHDGCCMYFSTSSLLFLYKSRMHFLQSHVKLCPYLQTFFTCISDFHF